MRKSDIKVGDEYAIHPGRVGRYSTVVRARIEELGAEREVRRHYSMHSSIVTKNDGVRCTLLEATTYPERPAGAELVIATRQVYMPWPEYAEAERRRKELEFARHQQTEANREACYQMSNALSGYGIEAEVSLGGRSVHIAAADAPKLLEALGESE